MIRDRWLLGRRCRSFTLQWHLTNVCEGRCRHCYDRSGRREPGLREALDIVADLQLFCRRNRVEPRISLSGGNPMRYAHFWELYKVIINAKIPVSILGNPIGSETMKRLCEIGAPTYYQVSLEGLREHNDAVRGAGHYDRVMSFLVEARKQGLETHVMLTLTRDNMGQVLALGEELRGFVRRFTFNRLSQVGEGASLELPAKIEFYDFLGKYAAARRTNPVLGLKDNLFNLLRHRFGRRPFPGCTGHGCGAAFNFVALLPDGEIHACRKYPSLLGNIIKANLHDIYHSSAAKEYRRGSVACRGCRLRNMCGGCPAVTYGQRMNPLKDRDPFCDMNLNH